MDRHPDRNRLMGGTLWYGITPTSNLAGVCPQLVELTNVYLANRTGQCRSYIAVAGGSTGPKKERSHRFLGLSTVWHPTEPLVSPADCSQ